MYIMCALIKTASCRLLPSCAHWGLAPDEQIRQYFGDSEPKINATLEKDITIPQRKPCWSATASCAPASRRRWKAPQPHQPVLFFDPRRYDLARFGRFKMNNKLCLSRRIAGYKTAGDIIAPLTGELAAKGRAHQPRKGC